MNRKFYVTIKKELKEIDRDNKLKKEIILNTILVAVGVFLFVFFINKKVDKKVYENDNVFYSVGFNYELTKQEFECIDPQFDVEFYETIEQLQDAYEEGHIDAYIVLDNNKYTVYTDNSRESSIHILDNISKYFNDYAKYLGEQYLKGINADLDRVYNPFSVTYQNLDNSLNEAKEEEILDDSLSGALGTIITILSLCITLGVSLRGSNESIVGEKEHGTLETMLTFPVKIQDFIMGKYLAITMASFIEGSANIVISAILFRIANLFIKLPQNIGINIGISQILLTIGIIFSYAVFLSGAFIVVGSFGRTYKDAQRKMAYAMMILFGMPIYYQTLNISLPSKVVSIIPGISHFEFQKIVLSRGLVFDDVINFCLMCISSLAYSIIFIKMISEVYKSEKRLF